MRTFTATEAKNNFGEMIDSMMADHVRIVRNGRTLGYLLPAKDYERMMDSQGNQAQQKLSQEDELETLRLYSSREITSSEAKTVLGCDRMELIEKLGRVGFGLPRLPREEVDKMADEVIKAMSLE